MAGPKWTEEQASAAELLLARGHTYSQVAAELKRTGIRPNCTNSSVRSFAVQRGVRSKAKGNYVPADEDVRPEDLPPTRVNLNLGEAEGSLTVDSIEFRDPERALEIANIDLSVWEVKSQTVKFWTVPMKVQERDEKGRLIGEKAMRVENAHIEIKLARRVVPTLQRVLEGVVERVREAKPLRPGKLHRLKGDPKCLLAIGLTDHHFGKFAWAAETGENYDLNIASRLYQDAIEEILRKAEPFGIEKILMPLGNDFYHIDSRRAMTEHGTPMDTDSRYAKIFETGLFAVYRAIEYALNFAPVEVVWIPGNHDPNASYHLVQVVKARFEGVEDRVTVDTSPVTRKYRQHGTNLVGMVHGHLLPHNDIPRIMADDVPAMWAATTCREVLTGHYHTRKSLKFVGTNPRGSTTLRVLPSLCGTDEWHHSKGFTGGPKSAEAYIYHSENGYDGHVAANADMRLLTA